MSKDYDAIVIGGGFFGLSIAYYLKSSLGQKRVLIIEKENDLMQRASYNNQARVHNGYHYPRSLLTALRSRVNFPSFVKDFQPAIKDNFDKYYAVATSFSKVNAAQFNLFCQRIGADITEAPDSIKSHFNDRLIDNVFKVKEYAFNTDTLKKLMLRHLDQLGADIILGQEVERVEPLQDGGLIVHTKERSYTTKKVFNCTYSMLNKVNLASGIQPIELKHELTEMCLVKIPDGLQDLSVTVMCGPFFSFMPFPDRDLHTLSHVRYTPHSEWQDKSDVDYRNGHEYLDTVSRRTHYPQMIADAKRYMPGLEGTEQVDSLWEVKTVLPQSEGDDSRPILFKSDYGIKDYTCIMGGKLDNIYDAFKELDLLYAKG